MSARTISTSRISASGAITALTTDGSRTLINGTFDWVYEEELMNYYADGWRWSPDGRSIAYWQLNADQVQGLQPDQQHRFALLPGDAGPVSQGRRSELGRACRDRQRVRRRPTRWLEIEGDPRNHYIGRMEWAANSSEVILQRLNRLQNTNEVLLGDARSGTGANRSDRAGQHLGGAGGRPHVARTEARASPGSASGTAGTTSTWCPGTENRFGRSLAEASMS